MGEEVDDGEDWVQRALEDPTLVAMAILGLRDHRWRAGAGPADLRSLRRPTSPLRPELSSSPEGFPAACGGEPPDLAPPAEGAAAEEVPVAAALPKWGLLGKRSRHITRWGIQEARREEAAVADGKKKAPASPPSPLDYRTGSYGASTSGGSGGEDGSSSPEKVAAKRPKTAEPAAAIPVEAGAHPGGGGVGGALPMKVVAREEQAPLVLSPPPPPKPIRRPGKKKTIPELQAWERDLLAEKRALEKVVEARRRDHEALMAENLRLKSALKSMRTLGAAVSPVPEGKQQPEGPEPPSHVAPSSPVQGRKDLLLLPDLNEPLAEIFD